MKKGRAQTMTHDYKRHGTTTLFAALNTLDGTGIADCMERHRHQEWLRFLRLIDARTPKDKQVHLIVDNYATHKHPDVLKWAARHKRFHFHFTPTSSSWLNMVERFSATSPRTNSAVKSSPVWRNFKRLSSTTSSSTTANRNPSSGQQKPTISSKRSSAEKL